MKYPLSPSTYVFNASAKTITFVGTIPADISNILHIANISRGVLYFQPQAGLSFSGIYSSPVLTILADTTGHANTDKLLIIYDDGLPGSTSAKQDVGNSSLSNIDSSLGSQSDSAASTDTGTSSLISFVKRGLQNWTTLLSRVPTLVSGRIPVDGSGVTQPISGSVTVSGTVTASGPLTDTQLRASAVPVSASALPLPSGAATASNQATANSSLSAIAGLNIPAHDYISLSYTGLNLTGVVYKTGGSGGTTVATLTLGYSGSILTSVTKS